MRTKPVEIKVAAGGRLMTGVSTDTAGAANWVVKREWRRILDEEVRAEGYDLFTPNPLLPAQPPTADPITLVATFSRPNRTAAVVVGTATTLYRYFGRDDWRYVSDGYVADGYVGEDLGVWVVIGSGFSPAGHRWEACSTNGYLVLNNGVDLPVTYRVEELKAYPIYELREQGIASVGTIAEHGGMLVCCDLRQIKEAKLAEVMVQYLALAAPRTTYDVAGSVIYDKKLTPGRRYSWKPGANDVQFVHTDGSNLITLTEASEFTAIGDSAVVFGTAPGATYTATLWEENQNAYGPVADALVDRYSWRVVQSMPDEPRRFAATIPCTVDPHSNTITLGYPVKSLANGQDLLILGAGVNGSNLKATISIIDGTSILLCSGAIRKETASMLAVVDKAVEVERVAKIVAAGTASTLTAAIAFQASAQADADSDPDNTDLANALATASEKVDAAREKDNAAKAAVVAATEARQKAEASIKDLETEIIRYDAVGSVAGVYKDIQGNGSAILRALSLKGDLLVYKESQIFIGRYTGQAQDPWDFDDLKVPASKALKYPDTLVCVDSAAHMYAGSSMFLVMDLVNRVPAEIPQLQVCQDIFFKAVKAGAYVFGVDNPLTQEIWWLFPNASGVDKGIRFDYRHGTVSTTGVAYTAAGAVLRPEAIGTAQLETWFIMGTASGGILRYGLLDTETVESGSVTGTLTDGTVMASGAIFDDRMVGRTVEFSSGVCVAITSVTSPTVAVVIGTGMAAGLTFKIHPWIHHRNGAGYDSVIESGLDTFGLPSGEKLWNGYSLVLGSGSTDTPVVITLRKARLSSKPIDVGPVVLPSPLNKNSVKLMLTGYLIGDKIVVSGMHNRATLLAREFDVVPRNTLSWSKV